jgi:hypothetical protein
VTPLTLLGLAVMGSWCAVIARYRREIRARWVEPAFCRPILVFESDDWGAGPQAQADALRQIARILAEFSDREGRHPVMTLGIVLEVPDGKAFTAQPNLYTPLGLDAPIFADVRATMADGVAAQVFEPQLHGACHYWPAALMAAARECVEIANWCRMDSPPMTERLPSPLQSRWTDASTLPSRPLDDQAVADAVAAELAAFERILGVKPRVAVPMTFLWTAAVERAWREQGIEIIITCGQRATQRDGAGELAGVDRRMVTGERADGQQLYLVRDAYFEPARGHRPERVTQSLLERRRLGRACLVETHRENFLVDPQGSMQALRAAIRDVLANVPAVAFLTPASIARALAEPESGLVEHRSWKRLVTLARRMREVDGFRRAARITGLGLLLWGKP